MSSLESLFGVDAAPMSPGARAAVAEADARAAVLEARCATLLTLLNGEIAGRGFLAVVRPTGTIVVGPVAELDAR